MTSCSIKKEGKAAALILFCVPILKIYFIQVLLKAVFIQEVLLLMNDWGFLPLLTPPTTTFLHKTAHIAVCNFLFLIFNSIFNVLLCAIATFPHNMWREKSIKIIKKRLEGLEGIFLLWHCNMWKISRLLCSRMMKKYRIRETRMKFSLF